MEQGPGALLGCERRHYQGLTLPTLPFRLISAFSEVFFSLFLPMKPQLYVRSRYLNPHYSLHTTRLSHFLHQALATLPIPRTVCRAWVMWEQPEQSCRLWFPFLLLLSAINFMDLHRVCSWLVPGWLKFGQFICCFSHSSKHSLSGYGDLRAWETYSPSQFVQWLTILTA